MYALKSNPHRYSDEDISNLRLKIIDELLKLVQSLSGSIDVSKLLRDASALCFSERAAEIELPALPPRLEH